MALINGGIEFIMGEKMGKRKKISEKKIEQCNRLPNCIVARKLFVQKESKRRKTIFCHPLVIKV